MYLLSFIEKLLDSNPNLGNYPIIMFMKDSKVLIPEQNFGCDIGTISIESLYRGNPNYGLIPDKLYSEITPLVSQLHKDFIEGADQVLVAPKNRKYAEDLVNRSTIIDNHLKIFIYEMDIEENCKKLFAYEYLALDDSPTGMWALFRARSGVGKRQAKRSFESPRKPQKNRDIPWL